MSNLKPTKANTPSTPVVKRFFRDIFKPTIALGKRNRSDEENDPPSPSPAPKPGQSCIALQNEDADEDAVVITALNEVPFCCHADLLVMTRDELVATASALNAKLPHALQVDTLRSDTFIRNSIEVIVGIRTDFPPPSMPNRTLSLNTLACDATFGRPSISTLHLPSLRSPLAARNQSDMSPRESLASPAVLLSLREEAEDSLTPDRPIKRRRIDNYSPSSVVTTPTPAARMLNRSQSHRVAPSRAQSPNQGGSREVSRSQSHRLPDRRFVGLHRNITVGRGRRASGHARKQDTIVTSTPPRRPRKSAPRSDAANIFDEHDSSLALTCSDISTTSLRSEERARRVIAWLDEERTKDVMAGLKNMGLEDSKPSDSEMDIDM